MFYKLHFVLKVMYCWGRCIALPNQVLIARNIETSSLFPILNISGAKHEADNNVKAFFAVVLDSKSFNKLVYKRLVWLVSMLESEIVS